MRHCCRAKRFTCATRRDTSDTVGLWPRQSRLDIVSMPSSFVVTAVTVDRRRQKGRRGPIGNVAQGLTDGFCVFFVRRVKLIECSAKDNVNVRELFMSLLVLSRKLNGAEDQAAGPLKRRSSAYVSHTKSSRRAENATAAAVSGPPGGGTASGYARDEHQLQQQQERAKPRSRSLIRRCSRKTKQQIRDTTAGANGGPDECNVS